MAYWKPLRPNREGPGKANRTIESARTCAEEFSVNAAEDRAQTEAPARWLVTLPPLVEETDILGHGIFLGRGIVANDHFAFLSATLRINRDRHIMGLDVDHESPQFEIIAQRFVRQAASV